LKKYLVAIVLLKRIELDIQKSLAFVA